MRDITFVILRLILGIIFICHGWDETSIIGVGKTAGYFVTANIPQVHLTVWVIVLAEPVGGALLILGFLASTVATAFITEMIGAWQSIRLGNGLLIRDNDTELVMLPIGGPVMILVFDASRFSLDRQPVR